MTIVELIKALEIKNSIVFDLSFLNSTILSCFFFFFLITNLLFLISAVTAQFFIPAAERLMLTRISTNETNAEIENATSNC